MAVHHLVIFYSLSLLQFLIHPSLSLPLCTDSIFSIQNIVSSFCSRRIKVFDFASVVNEQEDDEVKILGYGNRFGFDPLPLLISLDMETGFVCPFQQAALVLSGLGFMSATYMYLAG
ncbi:hypothetical protein L2E82_16988 [Cichorium intybus]|uniref:Uncharacterized protein n=1 Tax=Cichorium intybus TaxID=13427 RepID=A0ACB9F732_CICIN|nr:hypothetical protein L2E82_16988 [Cichorium intybus]